MRALFICALMLLSACDEKNEARRAKACSLFCGEQKGEIETFSTGDGYGRVCTCEDGRQTQVF